ncbi:outer membrane protein assembly factor BamB family protein [Rhodococcus sp. 2H158]
MAIGAGEGDDSQNGFPRPGIYAREPIEVWGYEIDQFADVLFAFGPNIITVDRDRTGGSARLASRELQTGDVVWSIDPQTLDCGHNEEDHNRLQAVAGYRNGSSSVVCRQQNQLAFFDVESGSQIATASSRGVQATRVFLTGDTVYSCTVDGRFVAIQSGDPVDLAKNWSLRVPVEDSRNCILFVEKSLVYATDLDAWATVATLNGEITYQAFDRSVFYLGDQVFFEHAASEAGGAVIDSSGARLFDAPKAIHIVRHWPIDRDLDLLIDNSNSVREPSTGEKLWTYDAPDEFSVVGRYGDVIVFYEDDFRLRGYDVNDGTALWAIGLDEIYPPDALEGGSVPELSSRNTTASDGRYLVFGGGKELVSLDTTTGAVAWRVNGPRRILFHHGGTMVVADETKVTTYRFE